MLFFFNDTATTEIYTLSLHDALPIYLHMQERVRCERSSARPRSVKRGLGLQPVKSDEGCIPGCGKKSGDRKSTRLNSSHSQISYAVFCLKKKKHQNKRRRQ